MSSIPFGRREASWNPQDEDDFIKCDCKSVRLISLLSKYSKRNAYECFLSEKSYLELIMASQWGCLFPKHILELLFWNSYEQLWILGPCPPWNSFSMSLHLFFCLPGVIIPQVCQAAFVTIQASAPKSIPQKDFYHGQSSLFALPHHFYSITMFYFV